MRLPARRGVRQRHAEIRDADMLDAPVRAADQAFRPVLQIGQRGAIGLRRGEVVGVVAGQIGVERSACGLGRSGGPGPERGERLLGLLAAGRGRVGRDLGGVDGHGKSLAG